MFLIPSERKESKQVNDSNLNNNNHNHFDDTTTPIICVYAICKNESQFVDRWYQSMSPADLIYVLDTGSTDDTYVKFKALEAKNPEKLKVFQAEIKPWHFGKARQYLLDLIPKNPNIVCIAVDLDEGFTNPQWANWVRSHWKCGTHERGTYGYIESANEEQNKRTFKYNWMHDRLGWRWVMPVHEYLVRAGDDGYVERYPVASSVLACDMKVVSLEHHPDRTKSRSQYKELLKMRLQENPEKDYQAMYYLANEERGSGNIEAAEELFLEIYQHDSARLSVIGAAMSLGDIYAAKKDKDAAQMWHQRAIIDENTSEMVCYIEPYIKLVNWLLLEKQHSTKEDNDYALKLLRAAARNCHGPYHLWIERGDIAYKRDFWILSTLAEWRAGNTEAARNCAAIAFVNNLDDDICRNNFKCCWGIKDVSTAIKNQI